MEEIGEVVGNKELKEMLIDKNSLVSIQYTIKDSEGLLLESSDNNFPLQFINGHGVLLTVIEAALMGRKRGEEIALVIEPEQAFGFPDENLKKTMLLQDMGDAELDLQVGEGFTFDDNDELCWLIENIENGEVHFNANNRWAGKVLYVHIWVMDVVNAYKEWSVSSEVVRVGSNSCGENCLCYR